MSCSCSIPQAERCCSSGLFFDLTGRFGARRAARLRGAGSRPHGYARPRCRCNAAPQCGIILRRPFPGRRGKEHVDLLEQIGDTAGSVWRALESRGPQSLGALKKNVKAPGDLVLMAVGWLAREEKLALEQKGRTQLLRLK